MLFNKKKFLLIRLLFFGSLFFACSADDSAHPSEDPVGGSFLSADIDGEKFQVNQVMGTMKSEKRISDLGTVNLSVIAESHEGRSIEFLILNYNGIRNYNIGRGFYNQSWISYTQKNPETTWRADKVSSNQWIYENRIEIIEDDGKSIRGSFTFEGHEAAAGSRKMVTGGDFYLNY